MLAGDVIVRASGRSPSMPSTLALIVHRHLSRLPGSQLLKEARGRLEAFSLTSTPENRIAEFTGRAHGRRVLASFLTGIR